MYISHIVAVGKNNEIGFENKMLWHIPEDFQNFKKLTTGHHILMGRKTFESIGKPLPNRTTIIISRNPDYKVEGCYSYSNISKAIQFAADAGEDELFIIGGAEIYKQTMLHCHNLYISKVEGEYDADTFYPEINKLFELKSSKEYPKTVKTPAWNFQIWQR